MNLATLPVLFFVLTRRPRREPLRAGVEWGVAAIWLLMEAFELAFLYPRTLGWILPDSELRLHVAWRVVVVLGFIAWSLRFSMRPGTRAGDEGLNHDLD